MRALVATRIDADHPLDVLELTTDWPAPEPRPGWAVIRVAATSVNPHDLWSMRGVGTDPALFPIVLGCDVVGWDAGGEPVIVHPVFGDPDRGGGDETLDPERTLLSELCDGALAEQVIVPERSVLPLPPWLGMREAACLPVAWTTAYRMLFTRARARPGQTVLVQGAGGGVATAAISLARAAGLYVYVTSRSSQKRSKALDLGAHEAIEPGARLPEQVDLVVDTVGEATWEHSLRVLRPGGQLLTSGATTGGAPSADLQRVFYRQLSIIGVTGSTRSEMIHLLRFLQATGVRPVIDSVFPLGSARDAFARSLEADLFGKVVVDVALPSDGAP